MEAKNVKINKEELIELFDGFLNDYGLYPQFENHIEEKGYTKEELGIEED